MVELKVYCDCGQKYKFEVEPLHGQMPFRVECPVCHSDGTAKANESLQQMAVPVEPAPAYATAGAPVAPPPMAPIPIAAAAPKLRVSASAPAAAPQPIAASVPPPIAPAIGAARPPLGGRMQAAHATAATEPGKKPSFAMGVLGAFAGAAVGAVLYFFIYKATASIPVVPSVLRYVLALRVGGLAGWLANLLGKGEGSKELGALAALFTVVGILAAQYLIQSSKFHERINYDEITQAIEDGGYSQSVKQAKEVVKAIPAGTDAEIRMYIAKEQTEDGQQPKLETVSTDEVQQFRVTELTNYQDLASGKLTKEQFWAKNGFDPKEAKKILDTGEKMANGWIAILAVLKAGIVSMIVGAGLAYKLSANA